MADRLDCLVVGAGAVGLAVALELARKGREVVVAERAEVVGGESSSRNSEVIHAGIYYPRGSLKARLCVAGKALLYDYCAAHQVAHRRCGKIIVATSKNQLETLRGYCASALANGAGALEWLDREAVHALEPEVAALAAVHSPSTGIIDSHGFMLSLLGELERLGGVLALNTEITRIEPHGDRLRVAAEGYELDAGWVVNSAGLEAPNVARMLTPDAPAAYYARGRYYAYSGASPFRRLVYPVAEPGGLGVHVTLDLGGQARFGPDVCWIDRIDYGFDDSQREAFVEAIRRYYPALDESRLHPGYTGIRPKINAPGAPAADFQIDGPAQHRVPGLVNLLGIESPGLTASLAIAKAVAAIVEG
ncbi:MAG: NAD(P)/FAD-dependent oxidoreductase [Gammaproteobacteria bacterium]|nr:NAD(P)/FAD-dependent oxidoreductase [Gammaproteobacteria bacterium]MDE0273099.1 NAD(P)/FAD-dependent oxidoreductase [Gammaproteobacteria bacterium]